MADSGADNAASNAEPKKTDGDHTDALKGWNEQHEFYEQQTRQSIGRQVESLRRTSACFSFGNVPETTGKVPDRELRCDAILVSPTAEVPGPTYDLPRPSTSPCVVAFGFGSERRFETKAEARPSQVYELGAIKGPASPRRSPHKESKNTAAKGKRFPGHRLILDLGASPFSSTFPYDEPKKADATAKILEEKSGRFSRTSVIESKEATVFAKLQALGLPPPKFNVIDPDLNRQQFRYKRGPQVKFGKAVRLTSRPCTSGTTPGKGPERDGRSPRVDFRTLLKERMGPMPPVAAKKAPIQPDAGTGPKDGRVAKPTTSPNYDPHPPILPIVPHDRFVWW